MTIDVPKEAEADVQKLQQYQQQFQILNMQKQNVESKVLELENSLKELDKVSKEGVFEIVGNIMIKREKEELKKKLQDDKQDLDLRLKALDKQVDRINEKMQKLQEKVMKMVKKDKK